MEGVCTGCYRETGGGEGSEHVVGRNCSRRGVEVIVGILIGFGAATQRSQWV